MRRTKTTVTSSGARAYRVTHHNRPHTYRERRNENGGNIRWTDELKPSRNIFKDKKHYYERF